MSKIGLPQMYSYFGPFILKMLGNTNIPMGFKKKQYECPSITRKIFGWENTSSVLRTLTFCTGTKTGVSLCDKIAQCALLRIAVCNFAKFHDLWLI